jgi:GNAT superfamily N-acetyltransferase
VRTPCLPRPRPANSSFPPMIRPVTEQDLDELLPLLRGYCEFYETDPTDEALLELSRWLLEHPEDGIQVLARDDRGTAIGFSTIYWTWRTMYAARVAVLEDLFVAPDARGTGVADDLIRDAVDRAREHGARDLTWQTAKSNERAQGVYDRIGAERDDRWLDYSLAARRGA